MIDDKYLEKCYGILGRKDVLSYMCFVHTENDSTGVAFEATIDDMTSMLANAALRNQKIWFALSFAYASVKQYFSENSEGAVNN